MTHTAATRVLDACRALAASGQQDMVWGHVAARDDDNRRVWIKRSGTGFDEPTLEDIHPVGWDGKRWMPVAGCPTLVFHSS